MYNVSRVGWSGPSTLTFSFIYFDNYKAPESCHAYRGLNSTYAPPVSDSLPPMKLKKTKKHLNPVDPTKLTVKICFPSHTCMIGMSVTVTSGHADSPNFLYCFWRKDRVLLIHHSQNQCVFSEKFAATVASPGNSSPSRPEIKLLVSFRSTYPFSDSPFLGL